MNYLKYSCIRIGFVCIYWEIKSRRPKEVIINFVCHLHEI